MRLARRAALLGAMALAMLALTAATASAQLEVHAESLEPQECGEVTISVHAVSGGCHLELRSEGGIAMVGYVPGPFVISVCEWHLEAKVGEDGNGYMTQMLFFPPPSQTCNRTPCDEADRTLLPWPLRIDEVAGQEMFEMGFCFRTVLSGPGGGGAWCELHIPLADLGEHNYEIGATDGEYFCEVPLGGSTPFSLQNAHLVNEVPASETDPDVEVIH